MNTFPFTTEQYAARLEELVLAEVAAEPARYGGIASWEDLHTVCDANEFVIDADESFGYSYPAPDSPEWEPYMTLVDDAIGRVEGRIFPLAAPE